MKTKILFIFFVYCFAWQVNAQTSNNTIVNDNSSWATLQYGYSWGADYAIVNALTTYHFFEGDSVVNGKTYKKVFYYKDEQHTERFFEGLMREDKKKTYFINSSPDGNTVETLLYDFSLEKNDTLRRIIQEPIVNHFDTTYFYIKKCDTVIVNEEQKKRMIIGYEGLTIDTVIENVGSLHGIMYPDWYLSVGVFRKLLCYTQNGVLLYQNPDYSKCYYSLEDFTSLQTRKIDIYSIHPNVVDDILTVSCSSGTIFRVEIFDISGKKVYSQPYKNTIDVSSFSKGLYLLKVYDRNEKVSLFKFIKK